MSVLPKVELPLSPPLTFDEFMQWYEHQEGHWELHDGRPVRKHDPARGQVERAGHVRTKLEIVLALRTAIQQAPVQCEALTDGIMVKINDQKGYEPDALVYCGERIDRDSLVAPAPVILVEVLSPSTAQKDLSDKLEDYLSLESVQHYLVLDPQSEKVWHYYRETDHIALNPVTDRQLFLQPPGITVDLSDVFA